MVKIGPKVSHPLSDDNNSSKTTKASPSQGRIYTQLSSKENAMPKTITNQISKSTTTPRDLKKSDIELRNK